MSNILLIEPNYKNKYPPIGLMKLSTFHKTIMHDYVHFTKGVMPEKSMSIIKWDRVYVTSLFTFEWNETISAIQYAKTLVDSLDKVVVGGIAATLMPQDIKAATGITPVCGLLNTPGKLGLPNDQCIDGLIPDYSILEDINYQYPSHDAYFLSATKGCGMKCGFCAVQTLEPIYVPYMDIKTKIHEIDAKYGQKRDLLLMDNNVLRSAEFDRIIDDIIAAGFGKGAHYINPSTGKRVRRFVDFNQGLDANLLTPEKAKRLGEIALKPARIAFDHIEDRVTYEKAVRLCAENGINELSNYILYNSEDFTGKGHAYLADTPANLYERMRISFDLKESINAGRPENEKISIFSFPMRYIPLSAQQRGYVGSCWNAKFLRAVQCMLIPTQGKGVGKQSFFEADFGRNAEEFVKFLCMPEKLIAARGKFVVGGRGRTGETEESALNRKKAWEINQLRLQEWNRLFHRLGNEREEFIRVIGDNVYLPEKWLKLSSELEKKLYLHYLTQPRLFTLLGLVEQSSPSFVLLYDYMRLEFPTMYHEMIKLLIHSESQHQSMIQNFIAFWGKDGLTDLLKELAKYDFKFNKQLKIWSKAWNDTTEIHALFQLIQLYRYFVELNILPEEDCRAAHAAILNCNTLRLKTIFRQYFNDFRQVVLRISPVEHGEKMLTWAESLIFHDMQLKIAD